MINCCNRYIVKKAWGLKIFVRFSVGCPPCDGLFGVDVEGGEEPFGQFHGQAYYVGE